MLRLLAVFTTLCLWLAACGDFGNVTRGAASYEQHCAICHGADLRGGGGVGVPGLSGIPADLTLLRVKAGGTFPKAEVLAILDNYAEGQQRGRMMRPFAHLYSDQLGRVTTQDGRTRVPRPQADLLAFLISVQEP